MLKIYGSMLCPDCVKCREDLNNAKVPYEYLDICEKLQNMKDFLALRDKNALFDPVREAGKIGIPCIVSDDETLTLDWEAFL